MDSPHNTSTTIDVYQLVTDQIIALLQQGVVPWQKPWREAGMPMNLLSKRAYRGINHVLLVSLGYERNHFLTWDQLKGIGGSVKRNEKGHIVVFWQKSKKDTEQPEAPEKSLPVFRYYKVFNIAQCRDIPEAMIPPPVPVIPSADPLAACEAILTTMPNPPDVVHKEQRAFYRIDTDTINMPKKKSFTSIESYYSTLYHELVHSTGAEKRLARKTLGDMVPFDTESYAMEELIAEMGSAFLCRCTDILPTEIKNAVSYLDNWLGVFQKDKRFLITASGYAQKAVDYILNTKGNEGGEETVVV